MENINFESPLLQRIASEKDMLEAICHKMFRLARELETSQICLKWTFECNGASA